MAEWLVELKGDKAELEYLSKLPSLQRWKVTEQGGKYYLKYIALESPTDVYDVLADASSIIDIMNGVTRLVFRSSQGAKVTGISQVEKNGKPPTQYIMLPFIPSEERFGIPAIRTGQELPEEASTPGSKWIKLAQEDEQVTKALELYGGLQPNWKNLYMVLEAIEDDVCGEGRLLKNNWAPEAQIRLFKQTANNFLALGREARHGTKTFKPPKKPMSLEEAQSLIKNILRKWLYSKCQNE